MSSPSKEKGNGKEKPRRQLSEKSWADEEDEGEEEEWEKEDTGRTHDDDDEEASEQRGILKSGPIFVRSGVLPGVYKRYWCVLQHGELKYWKSEAAYRRLPYSPRRRYKITRSSFTTDIDKFNALTLQYWEVNLLFALRMLQIEKKELFSFTFQLDGDHGMTDLKSHYSIIIATDNAFDTLTWRSNIYKEIKRAPFIDTDASLLERCFFATISIGCFPCCIEFRGILAKRSKFGKLTLPPPYDNDEYIRHVVLAANAYNDVHLRDNPRDAAVIDCGIPPDIADRIFTGWEYDINMSETIFSVYRGPGHVVLAIRGTVLSESADRADDLMVLRGRFSHSERLTQMKAVLREIKATLGDSKLTLTGHSLGGITAYFIGGGFDTFCFNMASSPFQRLHRTKGGRVLHWASVSDDIAVNAKVRTHWIPQYVDYSHRLHNHFIHGVRTDRETAARGLHSKWVQPHRARMVEQHSKIESHPEYSHIMKILMLKRKKEKKKKTDDEGEVPAAAE